MALDRARAGSRVFVLACLALLATGALPATVIAADDVAPTPLLGGYLRETRIVYPLTVQGWQAQGEKRYEQPELGVSVRYAQDAIPGWIDVFFYPVGEADAAVLDTHMRGSIADIGTLVGRQDVVAVHFDAMRARRIALQEVESESADGEVRTASGWIERASGRYDTAMTIGLRQLHFIKGRYSRPADSGGVPVGDLLDAFVGALFADVEIQSTGDCARALPIDVIAAGQAPSDAAVEGGDDDARRAVLTPDGRVVAADGDAPMTQALAELGAVMRRQRFPGCVGATPVEPHVPEGHREIRIEYRAPSPSRALVSID